MTREIGPQLANMVFLYLVMGFLNHRSRQMGKKGQAMRVYQVCLQQLCRDLVSPVGLDWSREGPPPPLPPQLLLLLLLPESPPGGGGGGEGVSLHS